MAKRKILSSKQRELFANRLTELGNLILLGLVIVQFVPGNNRIDQDTIVLGGLIFIMTYLSAYFLTRGGD